MVRLEDLGPVMEYRDMAPGWIRVYVGPYNASTYYDIDPEGKVYYAGIQIPEEAARIVRLAAWPIYEGEL